MPIPALAALAEGAAGAGAGASGMAAAGQGLGSIKGKLDELKNSAHALKDPLGFLTDKLDQVHGKITKTSQQFASLSQHFTGILTEGATALKAFADPIAELVQLANPAVIELFNWAFKDALAVIGRALLPVMLSLNKAMRMVGDTFARFEPILNALAESLTDTFQGVFAEIIRTVEEFGPELEVIADIFSEIVKNVGAVAVAMIGIFDSMMQGTHGLLRMLGFGAKERPGASGMGAAVRPVSIGTSAEDVSRKAQAKAFQLALAGENVGKTQDDVPNILDDIKTLLTNSLTAKFWIDIISEAIPKIPTPGDVVDKVEEKGEQFGRYLSKMLTG